MTPLSYYSSNLSLIALETRLLVLILLGTLYSKMDQVKFVEGSL